MDVSNTIFYLLDRENKLDLNYKELVYFILSSYQTIKNDYQRMTYTEFYYKVIEKISEKIYDTKFLAIIFNDFFPDVKNFYNVVYRHFFIQFAISKRVYNINNNSIDNIFDENKKNLFLIYIGYISNTYRYKHSNELNIAIDDYSSFTVNLTFLLDIVKKYIEKLSLSDNFSYENNYFWASKLFKEYVNSA